MARALPSLLLCTALAALAFPAGAAGLSAADQAEVKRAFAASALSSSEEPAVRAERAARAGADPSAPFMLGAALGSWSAAHEQLAFDLQNPSAAGPPHASQGAAVDDALEQDCRDERRAFDRLQARAGAAGLAPPQVLQAAGRSDPALLADWTARLAGPPAGCAAYP